MSELGTEIRGAAKSMADWISDAGGAVGWGLIVWAAVRWLLLPLFGFSAPAGIGAGEIIGLLAGALAVAVVYRRNRRDAV